MNGPVGKPSSSSTNAHTRNGRAIRVERRPNSTYSNYNPYARPAAGRENKPDETAVDGILSKVPAKLRHLIPAWDQSKPWTIINAYKAFLQIKNDSEDKSDEKVLDRSAAQQTPAATNATGGRGVEEAIPATNSKHSEPAADTANPLNSVKRRQSASPPPEQNQRLRSYKRVRFQPAEIPKIKLSIPPILRVDQIPADRLNKSGLWSVPMDDNDEDDDLDEASKASLAKPTIKPNTFNSGFATLMRRNLSGHEEVLMKRKELELEKKEKRFESEMQSKLDALEAKRKELEQKSESERIKTEKLQEQFKTNMMKQQEELQKELETLEKMRKDLEAEKKSAKEQLAKESSSSPLFINKPSSNPSGLSFGATSNANNSASGTNSTPSDKSDTPVFSLNFGTTNGSKPLENKNTAAGATLGTTSAGTGTENKPQAAGFGGSTLFSSSSNGVNTASTDKKPGLFGFSNGTDSSSKKDSPALNFGEKKDVSSTPAFNFGAPALSENSSSATPSFSFNAQPTSEKTPSSSTPTFTLGTASSDDKKTTPATPAFNFGAPSSGEKKDSSAPPAFSFGASATSSKDAGSGKPASLTFGAASSDKPASLTFGASSDKPASSTFGASSTTGEKPPAFSFGQPLGAKKDNAPFGSGSLATDASNKPGVSGQFSFGGGVSNNTPSLTFGGNSTGAPATNLFGQSGNKPENGGNNLFGGSSTAPAFGSSQPTPQPTAGASNGSSTFNFSFGGNTGEQNKLPALQFNSQPNFNFSSTGSTNPSDIFKSSAASVTAPPPPSMGTAGRKLAQARRRRHGIQ